MAWIDCSKKKLKLFCEEKLPTKVPTLGSFCIKPILCDQHIQAQLNKDKPFREFIHKLLQKTDIESIYSYEGDCYWESCCEYDPRDYYRYHRRPTKRHLHYCDIDCTFTQKKGTYKQIFTGPGAVPWRDVILVDYILL